MLRRRTDAASWLGVSPLAQPRDDSACPGELLFIIGRTWRIAAIAHRFKRRIDLAECGLGHGGVTAALGTRSRSSVSRFAVSTLEKNVVPVTLPPG